MRVQFETGLDDLVDVHLRFLGGSKWGVAQRRKARRWATVAFAAGMTLMGLSAARSAPGAVLAGFFTIVAVLSVAFSVVYGKVYDAQLRRRIRSYLVAHIGAERSWLCEIDLRPDGVWTRGQGMELTFPWTELTSVVDLPDGVLLRFRAGVIFARSRAFATAEDRARYVDLARTAQSARIE